MQKLAKIVLCLGGILAALSFAAAPASAQATRTWVSGVGDDANPCSRTAPCKTFAGSISKTLAGGEINCIDPGGFGALTITKSITISCEIGTAGVLVSGTNGFVVNAASTDVVVINGLDFEGLGTGLSGILILSAAKVDVRHSSIRNFKGASGITMSQANISTQLFVNDTLFINNGASATTGAIVIRPTGSGAANVVITNSNIDGNSSGVRADATATAGNVRMTIENSSVSGNANDGVTAIANASSGSVAIVDKSAISNNAGSGVVANNATLLLGASTVTGNAVGVSTANSGSLFTYKNNNINGNANDNVGAATVTALQ
jgi:hypothetical protein